MIVIIITIVIIVIMWVRDSAFLWSLLSLQGIIMYRGMLVPAAFRTHHFTSGHSCW